MSSEYYYPPQYKNKLFLLFTFVYNVCIFDIILKKYKLYKVSYVLKNKKIHCTASFFSSNPATGHFFK